MRLIWSKWPAGWIDFLDRSVPPVIHSHWRGLWVKWYSLEVLEIHPAPVRWIMRVTDFKRPGTSGPEWWHGERENLNMALVKMSEAFGETGGGAGAPPKDVASYPLLWEHVSVEKWPDGTKRETSTIIVVADSGGWRGCLSDKANGLVMWKTAASLEALLKALEKALEKVDPRDWRRASQPAKKK